MPGRFDQPRRVLLAHLFIASTVRTNENIIFSLRSYIILYYTPTHIRNINYKIKNFFFLSQNQSQHQDVVICNISLSRVSLLYRICRVPFIQSARVYRREKPLRGSWRRIIAETNAVLIPPRDWNDRSVDLASWFSQTRIYSPLGRPSSARQLIIPEVRDDGGDDGGGRDQ